MGTVTILIIPKYSFFSILHMKLSSGIWHELSVEEDLWLTLGRTRAHQGSFEVRISPEGCAQTPEVPIARYGVKPLNQENNQPCAQLAEHQKAAESRTLSQMLWNHWNLSPVQGQGSECCWIWGFLSCPSSWSPGRGDELMELPELGACPPHLPALPLPPEGFSSVVLTSKEHI